MDTFNPNPNQMPPISNIPKEKSIVPLVVVVVVLLAVIIGGLYMINKKADYQMIPAETQSDSIIDSLNQQSTSDNLDSIEKDLNSTNLDNLDQGASVIEAELQ